MDDKTKKLLIGKFSWKRLIRSTIIGTLMAYIAIMFIGYFMSDKVIFPAPKSSYEDSNLIKKTTLPDGTKISLHFFKTEKPKFYIIYNHGNAVDLGTTQLHLMNAKDVLHCSILAYDYPGYGTSEGTPSEKSVFAAADATYAYLKKQGIKDSQIIIWGRSVGSGPATYLAAKYPVAGLILESPFKSAFTVVTQIPIIPFDKFDNIAAIASINCPLLVMHGTDDQIIPFSHGKALYEAARQPKSNLWVKNAGHNNLDQVGDMQYWMAMKNFINSLSAEKQK